MLAELLLAIAILAIVGIMVAQVTTTSVRLSGSSGDRLIQLRLAEEALEALRAVSQGNNAASQGWNRLYQPPDGTGDPVTAKGGSQPYRVIQSGGAWILQSGEEQITLSGKTYSRKIIIENVCRDTTSGTIVTNAGVPPCISGNADDPGTQKITVTVTSSASPSVSLAVYFSRYLNEGLKQTNWNGGINSGPFDATSNVTTISSSQNADVGNANCGGGACIRLQP